MGFVSSGSLLAFKPCRKWSPVRAGTHAHQVDSHAQELISNAKSSHSYRLSWDRSNWSKLLVELDYMRGNVNVVSRPHICWFDRMWKMSPDMLNNADLRTAEEKEVDLILLFRLYKQTLSSHALLALEQTWDKAQFPQTHRTHLLPTRPGYQLWSWRRHKLQQ